MITVQAGVATRLVRDDPTGAEEALAHVRNGANTVLDELSGILSVMRQPDDLISSRDPLPTLGQLDRLIADFTAAGLQVEWHTSGERGPIAPAVELAAYRIIQESLTNAHRHGVNSSACLRVTHQPDSLEIEMLNRVAENGPSTSRHGHGVIGMHERIAAAAGTLDIGPTGDGRFRVHAVLPLSEDHR